MALNGCFELDNLGSSRFRWPSRVVRTARSKGLRVSVTLFCRVLVHVARRPSKVARLLDRFNELLGMELSSCSSEASRIKPVSSYVTSVQQLACFELNS